MTKAVPISRPRSLLLAAVLAIPVAALLAHPLMAQPTIKINNRTVTEGNAGTVQAVFTVTLSGVTTETVTVQYGGSPGSPAATAGAEGAECDVDGSGVDLERPQGRFPST
jgi:hypothetical protein